MQASFDGHSKFIRQLETVSRLDEDDRQALRRLPMLTRRLDANRDIFREGQKATDCCVILSGVAARCKMVAGGRRQIVSFHFAGDMPDLQSLLLDRMDHSLTALTAMQIGMIPHDTIRAASRLRPNLADAFHRQALVEGSIFREWVANVGRRMALERVAHVICECFERMAAVGLTTSDSFTLPITQSDLGDATGLSNVHINRTMQTLRKAGLVTSQGRVHTIHDWKRLRDTADFDSSYLHLLPQVTA